MKKNNTFFLNMLFLTILAAIVMILGHNGYKHENNIMVWFSFYQHMGRFQNVKYDHNSLDTLTISIHNVMITRRNCTKICTVK